MAWKSRSEEWSRPPEPSPDASGMLVQLPRAATECEFDLVPEPGQVMQRARTSDAKQHRSTQGGRPMNPFSTRAAGSRATSGSEGQSRLTCLTGRERQNFATCVDARFGARRIFW